MTKQYRWRGLYPLLTAANGFRTAALHGDYGTTGKTSWLQEDFKVWAAELLASVSFFIENNFSESSQAEVSELAGSRLEDLRKSKGDIS